MNRFKMSIRNMVCRVKVARVDRRIRSAEKLERQLMINRMRLKCRGAELPTGFEVFSRYKVGGDH